MQIWVQFLSFFFFLPTISVLVATLHPTHSPGVALEREAPPWLSGLHLLNFKLQVVTEVIQTTNSFP